MYCFILHITFTAFFSIPVSSTSHLFNKETQAGYFHLSNLKATSRAQPTRTHISFLRSDGAFFNFIRFLWCGFGGHCWREGGILKSFYESFQV